MALFRKKPIEVEAMRFDGQNDLEIMEWADKDTEQVIGRVGLQGANLVILTLEGPMRASPGDWIVRGVKGEIYPVKPDIFESTYEAV